MITAYLLKFFEQTFSFDNKVDIFHIRKNNDDVVSQYFMFLDGKLFTFKYNNFNKWHVSLLLNETFKRQVLYFPKTLKNEESLILLKTNTSIDIYQYRRNTFNLLLQTHDFDENLFHDVYGWDKPENNIKCGHFYYEQNLIGILNKHKKYGLQFYVVMKNALFSGEYPIWPLETDLSLLGNTSNSNFFLTDLQSKGQESIIVHSRSGIDVYEFNKKNELQHLLQVPDSSKTSDVEENLFFPFLTGQLLKDIVLFNTSGLFIYQYNMKYKNYNFIHYNPLFDKNKGWDDNYIETVRFKDLNYDGRDEMIFTGPEGIDILSFNDSTLEWKSLIDDSNIAIANRHSYIVAVGLSKSLNAESSILFTQRENKLYLANIERIEKKLHENFENELFDDTLSNITLTLSAIPSLMKIEVIDEEKPQILLRDQLDCSYIFKAVDQDTGKAIFKLPLIGLPNFAKDEKINFYYNGNNKASSLLGVGWTFSVGLITMDHQGSVFPEDERYFLYLEDFPQQLLFDSERSTDIVQFFKLSVQQTNTQIIYYKSEERWEIDYRGVKYIYGRRQKSNEDSLSLDLSWQYWRGAGSSLSGQSELVTAWFLTEIRNEYNSAIFYTYDVHNVFVPSSNKKYTREFYLKTISDNEGNKIVFKYLNKELSEYNLPPLIDEKGYYSAQKVQTRYLTGFSVTTDNYRQDINFIYKVEKGNRLLMKIMQESDPTNQPIMQFFYKQLLNSPLLEQVILPTGASVEFDYETIGGPANVIDRISLVCDVLKNYRIDYGQNFVLISYINKYQHVTLRMFNRALTTEMYSSLSLAESSRFPFVGRKGVRNYEVTFVEDTLVFNLNYSNNDKEVCLIRKEQNKLSFDQKYFNYDKDAIIKIGYDFIVVLDINKSILEVIIWDIKSEDWSKNKIQNVSIVNSTDLLLQISGKVFLIYNDDVVIVGYRNKSNEWHSKVITKLPGVISTIKRTLTRFDLKRDMYNELLNILKSNAFQISKNFMLFNRWNIEDAKIYSEIELFSLNSDYQVVNQEIHKINQDDLTQVSEKIEHEYDGKKSNITLAYEKDVDRFKIVVKDIHGPIKQEIDTLCEAETNRETCESAYKQNLNEQYRHHFILNLAKYLAHLQSPIALCGKIKFIFNGHDWKVETFNEKQSESKWSVSLDDKFVLYKENLQSSIKLYNQKKNLNQKGNLILDLAIKSSSQILNKYPTYLVYQKENREVNVVFYEFLNYANVTNTFALARGETLSLMSDHNTLVTHAERTSETENLTLNFRQFFDLRSNLPNAVIKKLTVNFYGNRRVTGYDYDPSSAKAIGDILNYEKTSTIPGNEYSSYGMIEDLKNTSDSLRTMYKIYDARGKLIKTLRNERFEANKKNITEESGSLNSTIFDITGNLEVAQFYPYELQGEDVGYYGFEDYEINKIGAINSTNGNHWFFNKTDIVKQAFSLTGDNYLHLSQTQLLGTFKTNNQNQIYVASCWIRSPQRMFEVGAIAPFLQAVVYSADNHNLNVSSEVKYQYDDWYYLEVIIDLITQQAFSSGLFKTVISLYPPLNTTLHVDHIRFSPLNSDFKATTYNFKTKEIKEIINANGLIKRYLYNDYQDEIASINENGEIEKFITSTKASSIGRIVSLKSKIEILSNRGFYEDFNPHSFVSRWKIDDDANWNITPSELHHRSNNLDKLKLRNMHTTFDSFGIRLHFSLRSEMSAIKFNDVIQLERRGNNSFVTYSEKVRRAPCSGEMLLIVENNRLIFWIDGGLYFDEGGLSNSLFDLETYGQVKIGKVLIFIDPNIHVSYFNALNEKVQDINLETQNSVVLTEFLYDELGRQCIKTKPTRLSRSADQSVVAYYSNFVTNKNPHSANSVWKIGQIQGDFESSLDPFGYYQVTYNDNPLNEKSRVGLPGQEFSVSGPFSKRFSSTTENQFINNHYPAEQNYRIQVEHKLGGIEDIKVFNDKNSTVAWLVNVPGKSGLLATYEYNDNGQLIQMLSPLYHEKVGTFRKLDTQIRFFSNVSNDLRNSLYFEAVYDKMGNIVSKRDLDAGKVEYLYSDGDLLKFNILYSRFNNTAVENVIYYNYDQLGRLISTGKLISPPAKEKLLNLELNKNNTEEYQVFSHSDFELEPLLRGRLKKTVTHNDGAQYIEESLFNEDNKHLSKRITLLHGNSDSREPLIMTTNKKYRAGKLREIEYPIDIEGKPFKIIYSYDKLGRIKAIGRLEKSNLFVDFAYNSDGQIEFEHHLPDRKTFNFTRKYNYNSAVFLTQLEDKFLTENIYYSEGNYDARGYGDGTISRTEFKASWHQYADSSKLGLNEKSFVSEAISLEESILCFNKLKAAGYLNQNNRQTKIYYPALEVDFPIVCSNGITSRQIQNILGKQGFPAKYGHLYDYGHYQELLKAKYFVGEDIPSPLQPDSFAQIIPQLNIEMSRDIWKILKNNRFIIADKAVTSDSYFKPHGKQGNSFIRSTLCDDLKNINSMYQYYCLPLEKILSFYFSKKQDLPTFKLNLISAMSKWFQSTNFEEHKEINNTENVIMEMLEKRDYLKNPLDSKFNDLFVKYQSIIPEIVGVLLEYFNKQLGEAEFDVEAYNIDENGNHKHYYTGFDRYELKYRENSNQIETININSFASLEPPRSFSMKHDSQGNVIQALHKGIKNITYHSVSNRPSNIELVDGKKVTFQYDAQGERVLKRVLDAAGLVIREVHYVRDEFGLSLVERELTWSSPNLPPSVLVTVFIYGPKGLIGFFRCDKYYSVITDHEGSIRLVVRDGEVVAAYDYLPYGNLMRQYGISSKAHISYRYTGQEWDEETGLYNYHARFYDPSIGRFYQHDPKMQYFSSYKYAGNSPVSMIDPNGETAYLLSVIFGLTGAYLNAAEATGTFDITKWNFKSPKLYASLGAGFLAGALLPSGVTSSIATFSGMGFSSAFSISVTVFLGAAGAYVNMAKSNNEWNPAEWKWRSPELWNGAFGGLGWAAVPGGIKASVNFYQRLSSPLTKFLFFVSTEASVGILVRMKLNGTKFNFSKPADYANVIESLTYAIDLPMSLYGGSRFFKKQLRNISKGLKYKALQHKIVFISDAPSWNFLISKSTIKFLGGTAVTGISGISGYYSQDEKLDFSSGAPYYSVITNALSGISLSSFYYKKRGNWINSVRNIKSKVAKKISKNTSNWYKNVVDVSQFRNKLFNKYRFRKHVVNYRNKRAAVKNNKRQDLDSYITENNDFVLDNYEESSGYEENKFIDVSINNMKEKSTNFSNHLFGRVRNSVNKLFDSKKILPEKDSDSKMLTGAVNSNKNLTTVTALVDINSTLLLLDTVFRKVTGQKYIFTSDDNTMPLLESRGYSLDIGVAFEKSIKYAALKSGISMHRFNIHYMEIQEKIIDKIMSGKLDEIAKILILHAEKACPRRETGCPGKLSPKKFEKFIDIFSKRMDIELNEIMQKNKGMIAI